MSNINFKSLEGKELEYGRLRTVSMTHQRMTHRYVMDWKLRYRFYDVTDRNRPD